MMNPKAKFFYYMSSPTEGMTESGTFSKDPSQWVVNCNCIFHFRKGPNFNA